VLDVGCGNGESLVLLSGIGYAAARGMEFDERACDAARSLGFEVRTGTAEVIPWEDASFDVVFLRHVIEHVLDPARAIAEALRVLVPGGLLSLLTPNAASRSHERFGAFWRGLESPRHLQLFTPPSLASLCANAGARVVRAGASDRSAWYVEKLSRACREQRRDDRARSEPFFAVAREVPRGEEVYLIAERA
jgi:SAM-dependent methyltransferase